MSRATLLPKNRSLYGLYGRVLLIGIYFGIVLVKSEVASWERINNMFLLAEPYMFLVMGTAIVVAGLSMKVIKQKQIVSVDNEPIVYKPKPYHMGVILGGGIFGMGWAMTGACPGPIYAQIGAGAWPALVTFMSALAGMYLYAYLQPKLPH